MKFPLVIFLQPFLSFWIPPKFFWPYFAGAVILIVGLAVTVRSGALKAPGLNRAIGFGPLFLAIPMAVFGADHFIAPKVVASIVPSWIPYHWFWVYFVGVALFAAALSISTRQHSALAASLLSAMLFSFVLLIHVPNLVKNPHSRILFAVLLRDLSFSGGALACALGQAGEAANRRFNWITTLVRYVIGIPTVVFGVEHFLFPQHVPVIPLELMVPAWIPGHEFLAYLTGVVLIACGLSIIFNWKARQAAAWLGIAVFVVILLVYLPILVANWSDIGNGWNYFVDTLAFSGAALLLAALLPAAERAATHSVEDTQSAINAVV